MVRLRSVALGVLGPLLPDLITRPAQRRLLSVLLLRQGSDLSRDRLIDCMWGNEPPRSARNALHVHINGLRKVIPDDVIATTSQGYRIESDGHGFDVSEFDRLAVAAHNADDPSERLRFIARALELWRGNPYQELTEDAFALPEIVRLKEHRLELVELHMQALLELGHNDEAIPQLRGLVERFPLSECLHGDLMLALYRSGRQAEALRQFQSARRVLGEEIGIEPGPALKKLEERILLQDPALGSADARPTPHNLPTFTTSFVGRDEGIASTVEALVTSRLVSIVGGPGFGKTRLAVELGHASFQDHPGGVWFAELAEARTVEDVTALIATATREKQNVSGLTDLAKALAPRPALLILDNCEQVVGDCATFAAAALAAGGDLRILVTSRRKLGIEGEQVWQLDPLPVPADSTSEMGLSDASTNVAVQLFVDRAQAVDRTFTLSTNSAPEIIELTNRLAGIPRAIELAARWVPALGIAEIVSMLDPTRLGAAECDGAQGARSFRAAVDWSLSLLPSEDRTLLEDTAVFSGWFGFSDVEAVCAGGRGRVQLAAAMVRIVDSSLLLATRRDDGSARYRMLVPMREFLFASRGPGWDDLEKTYVRHHRSKALTWQDDRSSGVAGPALADGDIDNLREFLDIGVDQGRADDVARALVPLNS